MKSAIVRKIGIAEFDRPALVNEALAANDRAKLRLTLLQLARAHAEQPQRPIPDLQPELLASNLGDVQAVELVSGAEKTVEGYRIPGAPILLAGLAEELGTMAAPLDGAFAGPLGNARELLSSQATDVLSGPFIDRLTRIDGGDGEMQLHRVIMNMHQALNRLQASMAQEKIGVIAAYKIAPDDRALVQAFSRGLEQTSGLKFGHPGLGSTETRDGDRLLIQNDIGTTEAHVLVVQVRDQTVQVTYSDVHPERLAFFQRQLEDTDIVWRALAQDALGGAEGAFVLATGTLTASSPGGVEAFLERLGSRLVFLIDWNKARKQLHDFLTPEQRISLLDWAASSNIGHRAFLELGGARLLNDAIEATAIGIIHFGERLHDALGEEPAYRFLQFCLRVSTEAMQANQSSALVRDRIRAELAAEINASGYRLALATAEHAEFVFELASCVHTALVGLVAGQRPSARLLGPCKGWEHRADELVTETRQLARRRPNRIPICEVIEAADDAADALEDASFLLGLVNAEPLPASVLAMLEALGATVRKACQEWVKAAANVASDKALRNRDSAADFLTAVDRIGVLEHEADEDERRVTAAALVDARDFRQLHLATQVGDRLEETVDALRHASLILRDEALSDVLG